MRSLTELKKQAVLSILTEIEKLNNSSDKPISKSEICRRARVSRSFLRNHNDLMDSIDKVIAHKKDKT